MSDNHETMSREDLLAAAVEDALGCLESFFGAVKHEPTGWVLQAFTILQNATENAMIAERRESAACKPNHQRDEDCAGHIDDDTCTVCGVHHGDPCGFCGGRGFHTSDECPATFDIDSEEYDRALAAWERSKAK